MQSELSTQTVLTRGVAEVLPDMNTLAKRMEEGPIRLFLGIDPTGSTLTLGHSVVLRKIQQFADLGHEVILLIGNGTVRIGDPTGRDSTRPELTDAQIQENFASWKEQASLILNFEKIEIRKNGDWLDALTYVDMVKLLSKTTVQQLIERDMFQDRIKQGLPIYGHEIMYPLLQGYDSVVMDVDLEVGGTDQTFNMMMGRSLQKQYNNREKWVLSTPIINGTDGRKMSKSYGNFIALQENPRDMYGKLMSISDDMIIEYCTVLTDMPTQEIKNFEERLQSGENPMIFKKILAKTITEMYHSTEEARNAEEFFEKTVQGNAIPEDAPTITISQDTLLLDFLKKALPEESASQLRRLIDQKAIEMLPSKERPSSPEHTVKVSDEVIRVGKRKYFKVNHV
ncbi:MAG: tyrosine--tRNA ligase [Microgenomates group bacterium]